MEKIKCQFCEFAGNLQQVRVYKIDKSYAILCNNCFVDEINPLMDCMVYDKTFKDDISAEKSITTCKYNLQNSTVKYMEALSTFQRVLDSITRQYENLVDIASDITRFKQRVSDCGIRIKELIEEQKDVEENELEYSLIE